MQEVPLATLSDVCKCPGRPKRARRARRARAADADEPANQDDPLYFFDADNGDEFSGDEAEAEREAEAILVAHAEARHAALVEDVGRRRTCTSDCR